MYAHKYNANEKDCQLVLHRSIRKYGWDNFKKEILLQTNNEFLNDYEVKLIEMYDTWKNGLNMTSGGGGIRGHRWSHSESTKIKMSASHTGVSLSEIHKEKMRVPKSEQTRKRMRKPKSAEHCANISKGLKGRKHSAEHIENNRKAQIRRHLLKKSLPCSSFNINNFE